MENIRQIGVISVIVQLQAESKFVLKIMEGKIQVTRSLNLRPNHLRSSRIFVACCETVEKSLTFVTIFQMNRTVEHRV